MITIAQIRNSLDRAYREFKWRIFRRIQRFFTGYSYDMAWDPNYHMAKKIYPIFKRYAEIPPHGAPTHIILINNKKEYIKKYGKERVEQYLTLTGDKYDEELEERLFEHWREIVQHVLEAIEWIAVKDEGYPESLYDPNPKYNPEQKEAFHSEPAKDHPDMYVIILHEDWGETKLNGDRVRKFEDHISEGFRLLGLYWRSFWD